MADLLLMTRATPSGYEDGDILCAMSERRILCCHTEHVCHVRKAPRTSNHCDPGTLAEDFQKARYRVKLVRDGKHGLLKVDVDTDTVIEEAKIEGTKATWADGTHCHVNLFFSRRLKHVGKHRVFGSPGSEVYYDRPRTPDLAKLNAIWARIEAETLLLKADHTKWPFSRREKTAFLPLNFSALTDAEAADLAKPLLDETDPDNPVMVKKRASRIDYATLYASKKGDIQDITKEVDLRDGASKVAATSDVTVKELR